MTEDKREALAVKGDKGDKGQVAETEGEGGTSRRRLSWWVGWVLVPASIVGVLFGGGAVLGAHFHESWFVRSIVWVVGLLA